MTYVIWFNSIFSAISLRYFHQESQMNNFYIGYLSHLGKIPGEGSINIASVGEIDADANPSVIKNMSILLRLKSVGTRRTLASYND